MKGRQMSLPLVTLLTYRLMMPVSTSASGACKACLLLMKPWSSSFVTLNKGVWLMSFASSDLPEDLVCPGLESVVLVNGRG